MDEAGTRLLIVAILGAATFGVVYALRRRDRRPLRIQGVGLEPGVYLFTSDTCESCAEARRAIVALVGSSGFTEVTWEGDPGTFERLGVEAVPATLIVDGAGSGVLHPGLPDGALFTRDP